MFHIDASIMCSENSSDMYADKSGVRARGIHEPLPIRQLRYQS